MKFEIIDKENLLKYEGKTADIERKIDESEDRLKEKEEALRNIIQKINAGKTVPEDHIESCFTVKLIKEFCKQEGTEENKLLNFSRKIDCLNHEVHESLNEDDGEDHSIEQELEDRNNLIHQYGELFALVLRDLNPETQYDKRPRLNLDYPLIDLMNFCASLSEKNDHDTEKSEEIPDCSPENDSDSAEKKDDMKKNSSDV